MDKKQSLNKRDEVGNEEDFATLFARYEESKQQIKTGEVVNGRIVTIFDTEVLVDAGGRSEGILKKEEITGPDGTLLFNVGDTIPVLVETGAGADQQLRLSYTRAARFRKQAALQEAIQSGRLLEGKVVEVVKGGLLVDVGMRGFVPASQIDEQYVKDLKTFVGQTLSFKVIQHDLPNGKLILSRRAVLKEMSAERRRETLASLQEGVRRVGVVKRILDYGVFVDIGGIEGLLHISEMSWKRIKHPSELFQVGDEIEVEVLKYDREKNRISLSYRKAEEDPWLMAAEYYPEGTLLQGTITKMEHYGAFAELPTGIQGLIPVSEMSWTRRVTHPDQLMKVGDLVEAVVTRLDVPNRKMSLSLKQITEHPWDVFAREHQAGEILAGKVTRTADFCLFVELVEGVEGLVHVSELSDAPSKAQLSTYKPGQAIHVKILGIDLASRKVSLSIKAIQDAEVQQTVQQYLEGESDGSAHTLGDSFPEVLRQFSKNAE